MAKANLKNILTAVRDMINRSRIAYKDYLGEETVTETKVLVDGALSEQGTLTLKDPSFTGFVAGEEYEVTIDGATQTLTAISLNEDVAITNVTDFGNPGENFFIVAINPDKGQPICAASGTYIGKTISISQTKTTTTKKYDIKKVPQELIPDTIARSADVAKVETKAYNAFNKANAAQSTANAAKTAANNARTAADNAQSTANTAKTAADNAQAAANTAKLWGHGNRDYQAIAATVTLDSGTHYESLPGGYHLIVGEEYKSDILSFDSETWDGERMMFNNLASNITIYWDTERMEYVTSSLNMRQFTFSGLFLPQPNIAEGKFMVLPPYAVAKNVVLNSSTPGSTKQFLVTVDDAGTLSATEVTA